MAKSNKEAVYVEDVIPVVNELMVKYEQYCRALLSLEGMSFGEWVMKTRYPNMQIPIHSSLSNLLVTRRTSDARTWLIACFSNRHLPLHPTDQSELELVEE